MWVSLWGDIQFCGEPRFTVNRLPLEIETLDKVFISLNLVLKLHLQKNGEIFSRSYVIKMKETVTLTLHLHTSIITPPDWFT